MQKLHQSTWEHAILYAKKSSENYQNLIALFLRKTNIRTWRGLILLKFIFWFIQTTHEPFYLGKRNLVRLKIIDVPSSFIVMKLLNMVKVEILRLCWDKCWTTLCRILQFCARSYFKVFNVLNIMRKITRAWTYFTLPSFKNKKQAYDITSPSVRSSACSQPITPEPVGSFS
jgi:hypothetical protein